MDRKLAKNLFLSIAYNVLTVVVPFITAPYLGRTLGADMVGSYTYVLSIASYFLMFGLLGMRSYGNKIIARVRDSRLDRSKVFWEIYFMQAFTGLIAFIAYICYLFFWKNEFPIIALLMSMHVATAFLNVDWFSYGMEDFTSIAIRTSIIKLANLILVFSLVKEKSDFTTYCLIMSMEPIISVLSIWPTVKREIDFIPPKFGEVFSHLKGNILLFVPTIAASVYQTMDRIMIGGLASKSELAYYEYAEKITQVPMLLFTAMGALMLSRMSHVFAKDEKDALNTLAYSMDFSFLIGSSCCFGLAAISYELVNIYYGPSFAPSGPILMALTPMILFYGWANVIRMQYVIPNDLNYIYISSTIAGAIVNLILNLIFIPRYKAVGATIGTLAAQFTVALVFTICVRKRIPVKALFIRELPVILIGAIMGSVVFTISKLHTISLLWLIIDTLVGAFVFGLLYFFYGWKTKGNLASKLVLLLRNKMQCLIR